jgi:predicted dienelactone hydrolase
MRFWQRAEDVSFALNTLGNDNPFARDVNWKAAVMIGHSSGGQTAAALAGVILNMQQMREYCGTAAALGDLGCNFSTNAPPSYLSANQIGRSYRDPRISALVLLDPALGPAATNDSLRGVTTPTLIIGARDNDFLPFDAHAARYAREIPLAELVSLENGEGHFVFMDSCSHDFAAQGVSLCRDRPGVDRTRVQSGLLARILVFLGGL